MCDRFGKERTGKAGDDIDDLYGADGQHQFLGFISSHKANGHVDGNIPKRMHHDGVHKAFVGKEHSDDFPKRFSFFIFPFFNRSILHEHKANEIACVHEKHHGGDEKKTVVDVSVRNEAVKRSPHHKTDDDTRQKRDDLLRCRKIRAPIRIDVRIAPVKDKRCNQIISKICDQKASDDDGGTELRGNGQKGEQIQHQKEHLADAMNRDCRQFHISNVLYDKDRKHLKQECQ